MKDFNKILLIFLGYFIAGKLGLHFAYVHDSATAIWAPTGIALASCLLFGYRVWPAIFLAAFLVNFTTAGTIATSIGIAIGNTLEGLVGAYLVNTFASGKNAFLKAQDIFKYTVLIALVSTTISPNIGIVSLILGGYGQWADFPSVWFTWWMGDVSGALIIAPFILFWMARHKLYSTHYKLEAVLAFLVLILISLLLFGGTTKNYPLAFISIPPIVWIAFRFGRRETITAIVILGGFGLWGTLQGHGPFARSSANESLLFLQAFMDVMTVTALAVAVAIAEKRSIQKNLLSKEEWFRALIEKSSDAMSLTDPAGNIIYVSPSFTHVLGYAPEQVIGKSGLSLIHPDDAKKAISVTAKIVDKPGSSSVVEIRCKHKDGSYKFIEVTSTNLLNNPNINAVVSNFHDITERTVAAEKLAQEKAEAQALLESIGDGIVATDPLGKIILVNTAFVDLTGWKKSEVIGKLSENILGLLDEKGNKIDVKKRPLAQAISTGKKIVATHYLLRKNKTKFPARITASPVISEKKVIGGVKLFHDITHEKELDQAKDEFISLASHELRTPMTAIKGLVSMILDGDYGPINKGLMKPLNNIHESSDRQIHLINDLLDVSRLQTGKIHYVLAEFSLHQVLNEVAESLQPIAKEKNITLTIKHGEDQTVQADVQWVKQVLNNLVGNAFKYTEKGTITLSTKVDNDHVLVFVADSGIGIDPSEQNKLFGRFRQLSSNIAMKSVGSGLGLYISRSVARKMGGDIVLEKSAKGKGSTFVFSIPKAQSKLAQEINKEINDETK